MDLSLLDTDILSELLKQQNPTVTQHAAAYLQQHGQFALSLFTRFEVVRGYREKGATAQLARFETFCAHSLLLPITEAVFDRAADLWVAARRLGQPVGDADLLIAATALVEQRTLVTGNTAHFAWIVGLPLANWRLP